MKKMEALKNLKEQRVKGAANMGAAATSHLQNDKYMQDFEHAWDELRALQLNEPSQKTTVRAEIDRPSHLPAKNAQAQRGSQAIRSSAPAQPSADSRWPCNIASGWRCGPEKPAGRICNLSDRPSMCSVAVWQRNEVVVGSTDHALYVVDVQSGRKKRTLYTKTLGHTEWVSCVDVCADGKIVSGGMDSKLWLWPASGTAGTCMEGHSAPISKVCARWAAGLVASSSYDKTIRLWDTAGRTGRSISCLTGHSAPVLELDCAADGRLASGDRSGNIIMWDASTELASWQLKAAHKGHVTALAWMPEAGGGSSMLLSGGQDGTLCVWDTRSRAAVKKLPLHVNAQGQGAIGQILPGSAASANCIVTAGADKTLHVVDPSAGFVDAAEVRLTDFPYTLAAAGGLALCGCGDGSVHVVDITEGRTLYALGAGKAAIRGIEADARRLVASGDDGDVVIYDFQEVP